ncbi:hypothetical protein EDD86DRAFT_196588 [Gorgonomyces haynaldii]|nr:hypothetical protein EDD86DRAFT_196588 [Gorgonomyces haynaldii]
MSPESSTAAIPLLLLYHHSAAVFLESLVLQQSHLWSWICGIQQLWRYTSLLTLQMCCLISTNQDLSTVTLCSRNTDGPVLRESTASCLQINMETSSLE